MVSFLTSSSALNMQLISSSEDSDITGLHGVTYQKKEVFELCVDCTRGSQTRFAECSYTRILKCRNLNSPTFNPLTKNSTKRYLKILLVGRDRLCGLVSRIPGYRSGVSGFDSRHCKKKSSGSGPGSTQPRQCN
jgi:hypothetical protein